MTTTLPLFLQSSLDPKKLPPRSSLLIDSLHFARSTAPCQRILLLRWSTKNKTLLHNTTNTRWLLVPRQWSSPQLPPSTTPRLPPPQKPANRRAHRQSRAVRLPRPLIRTWITQRPSASESKMFPWPNHHPLRRRSRPVIMQ